MVRSLLAANAAADSAPSAPPATLRDALGRVPTLDEVAGALFDAARRETPSATPLPFPLDPALDALVRDALPRYRDAAWTWRR